MKRISLIAGAFAVALVLALPSIASARVDELGNTDPTPAASCPDNCQAVGRVSGYQVQQGQARNAFRAKERGKIVAFTITLGNPRQDQIDFFTNLFGGDPQVQLTVFRVGTKRRHRVTGKSEVFDLKRYYGSSPTFALSRPLTVKKDYVVGITVPTWAPAFSVGLGNDEAWRSSRDPEDCNDVRQDAAQVERGSLRTWGCFYRTARLLYTVTMVPNPKPTARDEDRDSRSRRSRR
ncbi:MAG: hypothetical protein ACRDJY_07575 [Thermoleophilaceae bacterium]